MSASTASLLGASISSLRTSTDLLASSISILDSGVSDLPRLSRVLAQTRHFELLPTSSLAAAQDAVLSELTPEVEALIARVQAHVEKLERREQGLRAKWELQEGRLGREAQTEQAFVSKAAVAAYPRPAGRSLGPVQELKAKQLRQKKERLSYAVERLNMQAQQTQRKLRMSIAAQDVKSRAETLGDDEDLID